MRKFFWILVMLFVAGCGGGGGGSSDSSDPVTSDTPTGNVSLHFVEENAPAQKTAALLETVPGRARIVLSSTNLGFKKVVDVAFGTTIEPITLPVATDYRVQAVFYSKGTPNELSSYGASVNTVSVSPNGTTQVELAMKKIAVTMTPPASVYSGTTYDMPEPSAVELAQYGLQPFWSLTVSTVPFTGRPHLTQTPTTVHKGLVAPAVPQQGFLYMQGEYLLKGDLLENGETAYNWTFVTEPQTPTVLKLASVNLPIDLPDDEVKPVITTFFLPTWKLASPVITPINIVASDNAGISGYKITTSETPAPLAGDPGWSATMPTSYTYTGAINLGVDNTITLYAWVKDPSGNVSAAQSATAVFNSSPVVNSFTVPSEILFTQKNVPVTISGTSHATSGVMQYLVTESPDLPEASAPWKTVTAPATSYQGTYSIHSITPMPGQRYLVPLYAWVKDANGISAFLSNAVIISDIPQVSAFNITSPVTTGKIVTIGNFAGQAAPGRTIAGYLVTASSYKPAAASFKAEIPTSFYYPGLTTGVPTIMTIYAWVIDNHGYVSEAKQLPVRFISP